MSEMWCSFAKVYESKIFGSSYLNYKPKRTTRQRETLADFSAYLAEVGGKWFLSFLQGFDLAGG